MCTCQFLLDGSQAFFVLHVYGNTTGATPRSQDLTLLSDPDQVHLGMNMVRCAYIVALVIMEVTQLSFA